MDDNLAESEWLASLASYLALKPPAKWHDTEEELFNNEIAELATRFHHVESILFVGTKSAKGAIGVRLSITQANGVEHEEVVHFTPEEAHQMRDLQTQFGVLLAKDTRLGLAAASRAILANVHKGDKRAHD